MHPDAEMNMIEVETPAGRWRHQSAAPGPRLRHATRRIEGYEETGGPGIVRAEMPMLAVPVIVTFGGSFAIRDRSQPTGERRLMRSFVAGLHNGPALVSSSGDARCLQVDLTPQAAMRLLRCDLADLADRTIDLADIIGADAARLEERLDAARTWAQRFALFEGFLAARLEREAPPTGLVDHALQAIIRSQGALRVRDIAAQAAVSRKHLAVVMRRATGHAPGTLAQVARFEHAVALMRSSQRPTLAQIAIDAGYADQAHFNRSFRVFAGMTPGDYLRDQQIL